MNGDFEQVRKALEDSEKKYRTAFEYSGTGMMLIEEDMTVSLINQRLADFSGYTKDEVEGRRRWYEFVHEEDRPRMLENYRLRNADPQAGPPAEYEFRYVHRNGDVRNMLINVGIIPGTRRRLVSLIDITERKRMEQSVRENERRYRDLFENANDIIYTHDLQGTFVTVNTAGEQTYGYTREELKKVNIRDIVDPAFLPVVLGKIKTKVEAGGTTGPYEILTYNRSGQPIWVEVNTRLTVDEKGTMAVEGIARDITQRKRAEKELLESRQQMSEVKDYIPAIMCELDAELKVLSVNKQGLAIFGFTEEEAKAGVWALDLVHPDDRARLLNDFENIKKGDYGNFVERRFMKKDGTVLSLIINSTPVYKDGQFVGIRSYMVDVSAKRKAENKLQSSEERFRSVFAASPIGMALFEPNGQISQMNRSFREMFSMHENAQPCEIRFSLFEDLPEASQCRARLEQGESVEFESDCDLKVVAENDGYSVTPVGSRCLLWHVTPLRSGEDRVSVLLAQVLDVTERKQAEQAKLKEAQAETERARKALDGLRKKMKRDSSFFNMVSRSEQMQKIFDILPQLAQTSTTVLVTGESGTGKELIARSLHELGPRKDRPFVAINCSALPDNLLESELFGYKAGAFTDAKKDKPGKFAVAHGGTLFLDEIGDISPAMQAKLLRVLQHKIIEPLGDTKSVAVDVRVIAATNRDLPAMVKQGVFREDLVYRIKVLNIALPPLRERRRDIPPLCEHFIALFNARYRRNVKKVSGDAMDALLAYHYPGNIRELENIIEHAFIFCKSDTIEPHHFPPEVVSRGSVSGDPFADVNSLEDVERMYLRRVIAEAGGSRLKAAQRLGIHKATLFRKLKALGIEGV